MSLVANESCLLGHIFATKTSSNIVSIEPSGLSDLTFRRFFRGYERRKMIKDPHPQRKIAFSYWIATKSDIFICMYYRLHVDYILYRKVRVMTLMTRGQPSAYHLGSARGHNLRDKQPLPNDRVTMDVYNNRRLGITRI